MNRFYKKSISFLLLLSAFCVAGAKEKEPIPEGYLPQAGDVAIGLSFNPVSAAHSLSFATGSAIGDNIVKIGEASYQMFLMAQDPMAAIQVKYKITDKLAFRGSFGFSGLHANYREYVLDDKARFVNPNSNQQVEDRILCDINVGNLQAGCEYSVGSRKLRFVMGAALVYAFGGGSLNFEYGNAVTSLNRAPSCTPLVDDKTNFKLNRWTSDGDMLYARPIKRYNVGVEHGIGLKADMGIEWFFISRLSLGAKVTITPVMFAFQPQTYTTYEGYSTHRGAVVSDYNVLVSPGSRYVLYGTETIGLDLSLHYYF
ncbi:MAG: hypothetical protein ACI30B_00920 [Paludibacteraceae bacterium]